MPAELARQARISFSVRRAGAQRNAGALPDADLRAHGGGESVTPSLRIGASEFGFIVDAFGQDIIGSRRRAATVALDAAQAAPR